MVTHSPVNMLGLVDEKETIRKSLSKLAINIRSSGRQGDLESVKELEQLELALREKLLEIAAILHLVDTSRRVTQTIQENVRDMNLARQLYQDYCAKYNT